MSVEKQNSNRFTRKSETPIGRNQYEINTFYHPSKGGLFGQYVETLPNMGKSGALIFREVTLAGKSDQIVAVPGYAALVDKPFVAGKWYEIQPTGEKTSDKSNQAYFDFLVYDLVPPNGKSEKIDDLPF